MIVNRITAQSMMDLAWKGPSLETISQKIIEVARNRQDHCIFEFQDYNYALEQKIALEKQDFTVLITTAGGYSGRGCIYLIVNWEK